MEYPQEIINELHRILKDNGKIIMTTPTNPAKPILETLAFFNLVDRDHIEDHKNYFSKNDLDRMLKKANFNKIKLKYFELGFNILTVASK